MIDPNTVEDEELRQTLLREQERDRRQAILDYWMETKLNREAEERRIRRQLDPYNLGLYD